MSRLAVTRSLAINATTADCFGPVRDFTAWSRWSPWLIAEPDCPLQYYEDGKGYAWDGDIIGAGKIRLLEEEVDSWMELELTFLRPWKSVAKVRFEFSAIGAETMVSWSMESRLPFFLFWMRGMMETFIGMDYDRGLRMLKDLVELGEVPSQISLPGTQEIPACDFVGIRQKATMEDIGPKMQAAFAQLGDWIKSSGVVPVGPFFASYDKFKARKGEVHLGYVVGFPVAEIPGTLGQDMVSGNLPACAAFVVEHVGPYRHLGNAWAVGMMHGRAKRFRQTKAKFRAPFERYDSDPAKVPEDELRTMVCFPVR